MTQVDAADAGIVRIDRGEETGLEKLFQRMGGIVRHRASLHIAGQIGLDADAALEQQVHDGGILGGAHGMPDTRRAQSIDRGDNALWSGRLPGMHGDLPTGVAALLEVPDKKFARPVAFVPGQVERDDFFPVVEEGPEFAPGARRTIGAGEDADKVGFHPGGGFALADAVLVSGLNALLGDSLSVLHDLPANVVALLLMILVSVTTSVASNVATASIFVPVVAGLADSMGIHPMLFMLSATLTSSLAFVLPVSTPPNAIAFSSGRLAVMDMIKVGTCLNVLGVLAVLLVLDTFGIALYGPWEEQPAWARRAGSSPPPPLRNNVTNLACTP